MTKQEIKLLIKSEAGSLTVTITDKGVQFDNDGAWIVDSPALDEPEDVDFVICPVRRVAAASKEETWEGDVVWGHTEVWWAREPDGKHIWWSAPNGPLDSYKPAPWPYPEVDPDGLEPDFEGVIHGLGGSAYELYIDREVVVPEGILVRNDPQMGYGFVWSLFDPAKEIKPG